MHRGLPESGVNIVSGVGNGDVQRLGIEANRPRTQGGLLSFYCYLSYLKRRKLYEIYIAP